MIRPGIIVPCKVDYHVRAVPPLSGLPETGVRIPGQQELYAVVDEDHGEKPGVHGRLQRRLLGTSDLP